MNKPLGPPIRLVSARLPDDLVRRFHELARSRGSSLTGEASRMLRELVEAELAKAARDSSAGKRTAA